VDAVFVGGERPVPTVRAVVPGTRPPRHDLADVTPASDTLVFGTPRTFATLPPDLVSFTAMPDLKGFLGIAPERIGTGSVTVVRNWRAGMSSK
jgi:hypothetical protein